MAKASDEPMTMGKVRSPTTSLRKITCWSDVSVMMMRLSSTWTAMGHSGATGGGDGVSLRVLAPHVSHVKDNADWIGRRARLSGAGEAQDRPCHDGATTQQHGFF